MTKVNRVVVVELPRGRGYSVQVHHEKGVDRRNFDYIAAGSATALAESVAEYHGVDAEYA